MEIKGDLLLELQVRNWDLRDGEGLRMEKTSERQRSWNGGIRLRTEKVFGSKGGFGMTRSGESSGVDSGSEGFLRGSSWKVGHVSST